MIADCDPRRSGADRLDDPCALVAEHSRAACLRSPVDRVVIGVADARCAETHERLPGAGRCKVELLQVAPGTATVTVKLGNVTQSTALTVKP